MLPGSAEGNTTGIALISLAFIVGGYVLVTALWYLMVYRPSRRERRSQPDDRADPPVDY